MLRNLKLFVVVLFFLPVTGFCQQPDTLINKLDSLNKKTESAGGQVNNIAPAVYNENNK